MDLSKIRDESDRLGNKNVNIEKSTESLETRKGPQCFQEYLETTEKIP